MAFDRDGNVYMASISLGLEEFRLGNLVSSTEISSIVVSKSEDDGLTWGEAVSTARSTVETTLARTIRAGNGERWRGLPG